MGKLSSNFNTRLETFFRGVAASEWIQGSDLSGKINAFSSADSDKTEKAYAVFETIVDSLLSSSYITAAKARNVSGGLAVLEKSLNDRIQFMFSAHNLSEAVKAIVGELPSPLPAAEEPAVVVEEPAPVVVEEPAPVVVEEPAPDTEDN